MAEAPRGAERILAGLNAAQAAAVTHEAGPLLIIAGAGTGKTTVITRRIAHLIATRRARPSEILALTFTDKAAAEMEERVDTLVPYGYADVQISTFHAFGDHLIRENALELGLTPDVRVLTRAEQVIFLRDHLFEFPLQHYRPLGDPTRHLQAILSHVSRLKDEDVGPDEYLAYAELLLANAADPESRLQAEQHVELARTYAQYQTLMARLGQVDFGDQIVEALRLFRTRPHVLRRYQDRFQHILVDEFQDTNYAQFEVVKLLAEKQPNLTVVADDDQCLVRGTQVETPEGPRPIETINPGDAVLTAVGKGFLGTSVVTRVFRQERPRRIVRLRTESGRQISVTENHKLFCYVPRKVDGPKPYAYVYLMDRRDMGWRLGVTNALSVRLCLERSADRIIGLRACRTEQEARYLETLWSLQYGIPTLPFKPRGGMMVIGEYLERLYRDLETRKGAERLATSLGIDLEAHHFALGAVFRGGQSRVKVIVSICYRRHNPKGRGRILKAPQVLHAVSVESSDPEVIARLRAADVPLRKARKGWLLRTVSASLREIGVRAEFLRDLTEGVLEIRFALGTRNVQHRAALVMPAGNVVLGHYLPIMTGNQVVYDRVVEISEERWIGPVYDLEVDRTHNFVADGVVVHNSIYKWRGAALSNVLEFKDRYPDAKDIVLTENYRCPQAVLDAAYRLIQHNNPDRLEAKYGISKRLQSLIGDGGGRAPQHLAFDTVSSEADEVAGMIASEHDRGRPYQDIAILVRANADADPYLRALNMRHIPWTFSGNAGLYGRPEVRLLIAFLRTVAHPDDSVSLHFLASSDIYQVPVVELTKCSTYADRRHRWLFDVLRQVPAEVELGDEGALAIRRLMADLERYMELARETPTGELLYQFLVDSGLMSRYAKAPAELEQEVQNVSKFFNRVRDASRVLKYDNVREFVNHLDALVEAGDDPAVAEAETDTPAVHVLTVHKAKGLEWPVVFLVDCVQNKFPSTRRHEPIEMPAALIKDTLPSGDFHEQEERRLFYVAMTRAKERLYLTSAEDLGRRRKWKVSQFVLEALDLPKDATRPFRARPIEELRRQAPPPDAIGVGLAPIPDDVELLVSHNQVDDYQTCPLKYYYIHILRIPLRQHHAIVYGSALHKAVEFYLRRRAAGSYTPLDDVLRAFGDAWRNEGFLSRAHEEQRRQAGLAALTRFYHEEEAGGRKPTAIEQDFGFNLGANRVRGRFDRLDELPEGTVVVDYKSSDVIDQRKADERARDSLQLKIYALACREMTGRLPVRVELRFLESGVAGRHQPGGEDVAGAREAIEEAARGIRQRRFQPSPSYQACRYCPYNQICPSTATQE